MKQQTNVPTLYINKDVALPDTDQWQHRFEIESESSGNIYVISQNVKKRHWGCSCMGWKRYRHCKHLAALGLPANEKPFEPKIIED